VGFFSIYFTAGISARELLVRQYHSKLNGLVYSVPWNQAQTTMAAKTVVIDFVANIKRYY
jgi:hypothetical protein